MGCSKVGLRLVMQLLTLLLWMYTMLLIELMGMLPSDLHAGWEHTVEHLRGDLLDLGVQGLEHGG